jgi:tetratricopeptide (TPR) repeat protein
MDLNGAFLHYQLLIDALLRMEPSSSNKDELVQFCKREYDGNLEELSIIREFELDYSDRRALRWYTRESFIYRLLNKALRVQNVDMLVLFRFIIRDLDGQLKELQCNQPQTPVRVFRCQFMFKEELAKLRNDVGKLISINSFLSTSMSREQALLFLNKPAVTDDRSVMFEIEADPQTDGVAKPFANISSQSDYAQEQEILFTLGSIFQLTEVYQENDIWILRMRHLGSQNHDLKDLYEHMRIKESTSSCLTLGRVMFNGGKLDQAERFYSKALDQLSSNHSDVAECYHGLGRVFEGRGNYDTSLRWHRKALQFRERTLPRNDPKIGDSHNSIGAIYWNTSQSEKALDSYNKGLTIFKKVAGKDDSEQVAYCYNNMAIVYEEEENHEEALHYYKQSQVILEQLLPDGHRHLAHLYNNMGIVYRYMEQFDLALEHYEHCLRNRLRSLPSDHPSVGATYRNMGLLYEDMRDFDKAFIYLQKASEIYHNALPPKHADIIRIDRDVDRIKPKARK